MDILSFLMILSLIGVVVLSIVAIRLQRELSSQRISCRDATAALIPQQTRCRNAEAAQRSLEADWQRMFDRFTVRRDVESLADILQEWGRDTGIGKQAEAALQRLGCHFEYHDEQGHWVETEIFSGPSDADKAANAIFDGGKYLTTEREWVIDSPRRVVIPSQTSA